MWSSLDINILHMRKFGVFHFHYGYRRYQIDTYVLSLVKMFVSRGRKAYIRLLLYEKNVGYKARGKEQPRNLILFIHYAKGVNKHSKI